MKQILPTVQTVAHLREQVNEWHAEGLTVALVPTMGALHEGHLSLVDVALEHADKVIVSIFVNPTQFSPEEDFSTYPRTFESDSKKLKKRKAHLIFAPHVSEMYHKDEATRVIVGGISEDLCGNSRPHFFEGVSTVVSKLLIQANADFAIFGEKDYQQLLVIQTMTRDLCIPTEIIGAKIVRETDGLAMSSRNEYLSDSDREKAPMLFESMKKIISEVSNGSNIDSSIHSAKQRLIAAGFTIDYIEVRNAATLHVLDTNEDDSPTARIFGAVILGKTRLIDNLEVSIPST